MHPLVITTWFIMNDPLKQKPETSFTNISLFFSLGRPFYRPSHNFTLKMLSHILQTYIFQFLLVGVNSFGGNIPFGNVPWDICPLILTFWNSGIYFPLIHPLSFMSQLNETSWEQPSLTLPQTSSTVVHSLDLCQYPLL